MSTAVMVALMKMNRPVPVVDVGGVSSLLYYPSRISFTPLSHHDRWSIQGQWDTAAHTGKTLSLTQAEKWNAHFLLALSK